MGFGVVLGFDMLCGLGTTLALFVSVQWKWSSSWVPICACWLQGPRVVVSILLVCELSVVDWNVVLKDLCVVLAPLTITCMPLLGRRGTMFNRFVMCMATMHRVLYVTCTVLFYSPTEVVGP